MEFWDSSKTRIGAGSYTSSGTGSWQKATASSTAPAGTVAVTVLLYSSMGNTGKCYYDDVSIEGLTSFQYAYNIDITSTKQYFYDNYIIESMSNLTRTVNPGTKYGTVLLTATNTWEGWFGEGQSPNPALIISDVIYDSTDSIYKMWYSSYSTTEYRYYLCYATSSDGISWTKPNLGLYTYDGNTNNNIIRDHWQGMGTVIKDPLESISSKIYKIFGWRGPWGDPNEGHYIYYSNNGLSWTAPYSTARFLGSDGYRDGWNMSYDPIHSNYIYYIKYWPNGEGERTYRITTSTDFESWTTPKASFAADVEDRMTYTATDIYAVPSYPTDGGIFAFPTVFSQMIGGNDDGTVAIQLACGRDAAHLVRPSRTAVIPNGAPESWEAGQIYATNYPIETEDQVRFYYSGLEHTHAVEGSGKISFTSWRKDGFVSLNAGGTEGAVVTKPITFTGNNGLFLNLDASGGGSVKVEILDSSNNIITGFSKNDCDAITSDDQNYKVTWDGSSDISSLAGQDIKFKIYLTNAKLYSLKTKTPIAKEAEDYNSMSGVVLQSPGIGYCDNGDWIRFDNVNFGNGYTQLISKVAVDNGYAGQKVEVRLDSTTGTLIGTLTVQGTGGWAAFEEQSIPLSNAYGTHNVYMCFKGSSGVGNFDWFKFQ